MIHTPCATARSLNDVIERPRALWEKVLFRASGHGLLLVLLILSGFATWSAISTADLGSIAVTSSALSDGYQLAARAVGAAESLERKYRLEPSADVQSRYNKAATDLETALTKIYQTGSNEDRELVQSVRAAQSAYLEATSRMFSAIERNDLAEVSRIDLEEADPLFSGMERTVTEASARHQKDAVTALEKLGMRERFNARAIPIVFSIGLAFAFLFSTALRRARTQLEGQRTDALHAARHDALTGLPNRTFLHDHFDQALNAGKLDGTVIGLLLIDLDRFKEVNDTLGHHYGDRLLAQVGARLANLVREGDIVARLGGDEFAVLLPRIESLEQAAAMAHRLRDAIVVAFNIDGIALDIEASIGVVVSTLHGCDSITLMQHADIAMYAAKKQGTGVMVYDSKSDRRTHTQLALLSELRRGIERTELFLQYQPKVSVASGEVVGVEALVRWMHPERGLVPPDEFIPFAERTGVIGALTYYVLNASLQQVRIWADTGLHMPVSVNISARNLSDPALVAQVTELLGLHSLVPEMLVLEVTESAIMVDSTAARTILRTLHDIGVRISIDDFGVGYTSLAQLKDLPISELKIDKSFVLTMQTDEANALIVRSVIDLGHNLGMTVVAEGVETNSAVEVLRDFGCDIAQGFHLCRPVNADAFVRWLAERKCPVANVSTIAA